MAESYTDSFRQQILAQATSFSEQADQAVRALEASFEFGGGESQEAEQALAEATQFFLDATQRSAVLAASCRELAVAFEFLNAPERSDGRMAGRSFFLP